jgi:hypothetical protein
MSKLYFTSSFLPSGIQGKFMDLEEVFEYFKSDDIILIFDTNVVIEYRNYYFNPSSFTLNKDRVEFLKSLRSLVKKIHTYNLEVNASFGVEESSREPESFEINLAKAKQTRETVLDMFYTSYSAFDRHFSEPQYFGKEIRLNSDYLTSKIDCLNVPSIFQHLLIISYLMLLKIVDLYFEYTSKSKTNIEAFKEFIDFMTNDVDITGGMHFNYAVHLFGGAPKFQTLWKKKGKTKEKKLHDIFNASIDLITPTIADKTQSIYDEIGERKLSPVFVTGDIVLADLLSLQKVLINFNDDHEIVTKSYMPQITYCEFMSEKLNWTADEYEIIKSYNFKVSKERLEGFEKIENKGVTAFHLIPKVKALEDKVMLNL